MKNIFLTFIFFSMIQSAWAEGKTQPTTADKNLAELCEKSREDCRNAWNKADQEIKKKFQTVHACQQACLDALKACNDSKKHAKRMNDPKEKGDALENFNSASGYNMDCQRMSQERSNLDEKSNGK